MNHVLKLARIEDIAHQTTFSKSTIWSKIAKGEFLPPTKIGGIAFWKQSDVDEWIESQFTKSQKEAV